MKAPPEFGVKVNQCLRLDKYVYGEDDAPFVWYVSFRKGAVDSGAMVHSQDKCVFLWYVATGDEDFPWLLVGQLKIHVDDFSAAGNAQWLQVKFDSEGNARWRNHFKVGATLALETTMLALRQGTITGTGRRLLIFRSDLVRVLFKGVPTLFWESAAVIRHSMGGNYYRAVHTYLRDQIGVPPAAGGGRGALEQRHRRHAVGRRPPRARQAGQVRRGREQVVEREERARLGVRRDGAGPLDDDGLAQPALVQPAHNTPAQLNKPR